MKKILLFDTSIGTDNIGDDIIVDYCYKQLLSTLGKSAFMCSIYNRLLLNIL